MVRFSGRFDWVLPVLVSLAVGAGISSGGGCGVSSTLPSAISDTGIGGKPTANGGMVGSSAGGSAGNPGDGTGRSANGGAAGGNFGTMDAGNGAGGAKSGVGGRSAGAGGGSVTDGGALAGDSGSIPAACVGVDPGHTLIANFDDSSDRAFGQFGVDRVAGGTYVVPTELVDDFSQGNWHVIGSVSNQSPSYLGFYWVCTASPNGSCPLDLSRYAGVQFTVGGNVGPGGALTFAMGIVPDDSPLTNAGCGTCTAVDGGISICRGPSVVLNNIATAPRVIRVLWSDLQGGYTVPSVDPRQITGMAWFLPPASGGDGGSASYVVDFTLDDIQLIPTNP